MNPELRAALAALIRQYLEQTAKAEAKGAAKGAAKNTAKATAEKATSGIGGSVGVPPNMALVPVPGQSSLPVPIGPRGITPYVPPTAGAGPTVVPGMDTGNWMTPGAAATAIGAALLLRQMTGDDKGQASQASQAAPGFFSAESTRPPINITEPLQQFDPNAFLGAQVVGPQPVAQPVPLSVPTVSAASRPAIAPQTAPRMTAQPSPQLAVPAGAVNGQVPVPQVAPPKASLSLAEQLGRPEIYGMLGQLAQAIAPGSFGANLGGFASNRAQGILTNQALMNLLQSNPTLGLSDAAAGTLGPQAVASLGQQALQYDLGNDQTAIRAFEAESPEQRLAREYLIATTERPSNKNFRASVNVDPEGRETAPGRQYTWLFDEQGNRVKVLGGDFVSQSTGQPPEDLAGKRATQLRLHLESARKEALTLTAMEFKEIMIADPNDPANFVVNPYAPPEALKRFKENYIRAVQDRQDNQQLPDNLAVLGEVVRKRGTALPTAAAPGPVAPRGSFNDIK